MVFLGIGVFLVPSWPYVHTGGYRGVILVTVVKGGIVGLRHCFVSFGNLGEIW